MTTIKVENISKTYLSGKDHVHAVRGVSFRLHRGESVSVMGPSGSGKSTLLSIMGGLSEPSGGNVIIDGIDVYALDAERRADLRREYLGFVFQSFQLLPYLTVEENVMLPLSVTDRPKREHASIARDILERVGLGSKARRLPDELSGGEQQRVALARALVNDPPIVLADEPTGNLDSGTGGEIMKLLRGLTEEGHTVVMVTHNPEFIRYADRCLNLRDGRLVNGEPGHPALDVQAAEVEKNEGGRKREKSRMGGV